MSAITIWPTFSASVIFASIWLTLESTSVVSGLQTVAPPEELAPLVDVPLEVPLDVPPLLAELPPDEPPPDEPPLLAELPPDDPPPLAELPPDEPPPLAELPPDELPLDALPPDDPPLLDEVPPDDPLLEDPSSSSIVFCDEQPPPMAPAAARTTRVAKTGATFRELDIRAAGRRLPRCCCDRNMRTSSAADTSGSVRIHEPVCSSRRRAVKDLPKTCKSAGSSVHIEMA
jgi:hypothetical protein